MTLTTDQIYKKLLKRVENLIGNDKTTFSTDLNNVGKYLFGKKFRGVFSADQIPKLTSQQPYCIVNLDTSNELGSHWVSLAKQNGKVYFYDSFGRPNKHILPLLSKSGNGKILDTDEDREQGFADTDCGQRSLCWILLFDEYGAEKALEI